MRPNFILKSLSERITIINDDCIEACHPCPTFNRGDYSVAITDFCLSLDTPDEGGPDDAFMDELIARSSLVIALYGRSGVSSCGHNEHGSILDAIEAGDADRACSLMLHHIDHIEADLDLRAQEGLTLKDALAL